MRGYDELFRFFEENLVEQKFSHQPIELYGPITYTLKLGGKRIRPVLTLMSCEMYGGKASDALPQAIAIELFHNFTLIHDDIMDNAPLRRGKKSVFKKWNPNIAILSGDTLFALAYQYAQQANRNILPEILSVFNNTAIEVCEGQQYDLNYEKMNKVSVDEYIEMIRLKTAVLFGASLKIGALIGGATTEDSENLYDFGLNVGLGFQLKDDLLDTFGDEELFGKKTGGDILTNKKTFLYLTALERANKKEKTKLFDLYNSNPENERKKIQEVIDIFTHLKVFEAANMEIDKYWDNGLQSLDKVNISEENKEKLLYVAHKMIDRQK
jgi:geranylgeranyl diphosphate synthase type II